MPKKHKLQATITLGLKLLGLLSEATAMANNFNIPKLMVLDTAGAGDVLTANAPVKIKSIRWSPGAAVTGDSVVLTNSAGDSIYEHQIVTSLAVNAGAPAVFEPALLVKGLKLPTIARGKLFIHTV